MKASDVVAALKAIAADDQRVANEWFFKTGPGEYGEGDKFLGVKVPPMRVVARRFKELPLKEVAQLLRNEFHEVRLTALFIMVGQFERATDATVRQDIYWAYLKALDEGTVNNWDLVDSSAHKIVGAWLLDKDRSPLHILSKSNKLWHQRVSVIACLWFISRNDFDDALVIAGRLVNHQHDLIHKAVGWMLREIGKRDQAAEEAFLRQHYKTMPRTMLRYAIERFEESRRQQYLKGAI